MAATTKIEWTDATWNPLRGCSKVSAGCANCYAVGMAARFSKPGLWGHGLVERTPSGPRWTGNVVLDERALTAPLRWKKPRRIFVASGSDPFHPAVTNEMLDRIFAVMALAPQHTFQLLTKRPERMLEYMTRRDTHRHPAMTTAALVAATGCWATPAISLAAWPLQNLWLGTSVENQDAADERIPHLLATPAAVRFLSCEPLLGPVRLTNMDINRHIAARQLGRIGGYWINALTGENDDMGRPCPDVPRLDWVIVGGESGPEARPMHPDWARSLRDQCAAAGVEFFFKQWGAFTPLAAEDLDWFARRKAAGGFADRQHLIDETTGWPMYRTGKRFAGRLLDGQEHLELPRT